MNIESKSNVREASGQVDPLIRLFSQNAQGGLSWRILMCFIAQTGHTQSQIAAELGISQSTVSYAIRTGSSERVRSWVQAHTGIPADRIWPDRYPRSPVQAS